MPLTLPLTILTFLSLFSLSLQALCNRQCYDCDELLGECLQCIFLVGPNTYYGMFRNRCYPLYSGCMESVFEVEGTTLVQRCVKCKQNYELTFNHTCTFSTESITKCTDPNCDICNYDQLDMCMYCKYANV